MECERDIALAFMFYLDVDYRELIRASRRSGLDVLDRSIILRKS